MRLFILLALGVALSAAIPQSEGRARLRGSRRFSLATPGLQKTAEEKPSDAAVEEPAAAATEVAAEPKTRSRGTSLLRRGRPSLRLRGRSGSRSEAPEAEAPATNKVQEEKPAQSSGTRRGGTRLRRLRKKPATTTTTTTTTTTVAPEEPTMMTKDESLPEVATKMMKEETKEKEVTVMDEPKATEDAGAVDKANIIPEEPPSEPKGTPGPRLRPIPIKLGRRGKVKQESPAEEPVNESTTQETASPVSKPTTHRFSSRPRPSRIQPRIRTSSRRQQEETAPEKEAVTPEATEEQSSQPEKPTRSRGRIPSFRRRGRPSLRQKADPKPEEPSTDLPAVEEPQQEANSRFPNIKELRSILKRPNQSRKPIIKQKRRRIRPVPQKPIKKSKTTEKSQNEKVLIDETPVVKAIEKDMKNDEAVTSFLLDKPSHEILPQEKKDDATMPPATTTTISTTQAAATTTTTSTTQTPVTPVVAKPKSTNKDSIIGAPISESVLKGRPQRRKRIRTKPQKTTPTTPTPTQAPLQNRRGGSRFPTPNYGGSDLTFRGGEIHMTQIGAIEDIPRSEVLEILSGLGSRKRGLARPSQRDQHRSLEPMTKENEVDMHMEGSKLQETLPIDVDYLYDYYDYPIEDLNPTA